ncbi:MAG: efflux RND transporter permease subunit, partial [Alphaproteobacteria bacterium]
MTNATSTIISAVVSLTLSPALCAQLLKPHGAHPAPAGIRGALGLPFRRFAGGFNRLFDRISGGYAALTRRLVRMSLVLLLVYAGLIALAAERFQSTPQGFIPQLDRGYLIAVVQLPAGSSLARTDAAIRKVSDILLGLEGVDHTVGFAGLDGATFTNAPNSGAVFFTMKRFGDRTGPPDDAFDILPRAFGALQAVKEATVFVVAPPSVSGVGNAGGWKLYVQDRR